MIDTPVIETERLFLRMPSADDLPALMAFLGSDRSRFYGGPYDAPAAWQRVAAYTGQWILRGYGMFAVTLRGTGETVGMAGPVHPSHFPEPEMSWLLTDARYEGKGYASEACSAVLGFLFDKLGWASTVSFVDHDNASSRALALRLGAQPDPDTQAEIANCETFRHTAEGLIR